MAEVPPFTRMTKRLYMGSKKALAPSMPIFDVYVSMAKEIQPPRTPYGDFESVWFKMDDVPWDFENDPETVRKLIELSSILARMVRQRKSVLVFCHMGMNRSGLMTGLILLQLGYSFDQAMEMIRRRSPCTVINESFEDFLYWISTSR